MRVAVRIRVDHALVQLRASRGLRRITRADPRRATRLTRMAAMPETPGSSRVEITRDEVRHLADLARIELDDAELDHLAPQLSVILESVASISEVAADDIPPTSHPLPVTNVFREDVVVPA